MTTNNSESTFDIWYARQISRRLNNRSGDLARNRGERPVSWGESQDYNASRLTTLLRRSYVELNPIWISAANKIRLQLDKQAKQAQRIWYDIEYRILSRINEPVKESSADTLQSNWEVRAKSEAQICNFRVKNYKYMRLKREVHTWNEAKGKCAKDINRRCITRHDFQGRELNLWELAYRSAKLKFSLFSAANDGWFRSVRDKIQRLAQQELTNEN